VLWWTLPACLPLEESAGAKEEEEKYLAFDLGLSGSGELVIIFQSL